MRSRTFSSFRSNMHGVTHVYAVEIEKSAITKSAR